MDPTSDSAKPYSCVICHKRKVRCDRKEPCSNCAKADAECIYRPPPPPRRRKRERDASIDASITASSERAKSRRRMSGGSTGDDDVVGSLPSTAIRPNVPEFKPSGSGRMIMKEGNSVYLDNTLWTSVSHELTDAAEVLDAPNNPDGYSSHDEDVGEDMMVMGGVSRDDLTALHPNPVHIFKLWQTFLENVNPLIKVLHTPTLQPQILDAVGNLAGIGKEMEALMFSIYCIALTSLQNGEVEKSFGESKKNMLAKCRRGAQFALGNASFLRTSNLMVLQALILYTLSMRTFSDPHTIWTMSGIALRIAQRIGIHRDGSGYGVSPFEAEIRRRLWLQVVIIDSTSAQFCGVTSSPLPMTADARPPININDSDLDPRMTEPPSEKEGPTDMIFCLTRSEFGKWLRRCSKNAGPFHSPWPFLSSSAMSLKEKDKAIDELEEILERKFLRHCDRSIPLHLATLMMGRSVIHYTRLMAHHPRQYQEKTVRLPQSEKDIIFENCLKMAEYADYTQTNPHIQRFSWHTVHHMPWDAMIFMLSEMRFRTDPEEKSKVWEIIGNIYSRHIRQRRSNAQLPLHRALENLMLKAWNAYIDECTTLNRIPTPCPTIVVTLLSNAKAAPRSTGAKGNVSPAQNGVIPMDTLHSASDGIENNHGELDFMLHDNSPMDWNEWDDLLNQFQESLMDDMALMTTSTS